MESTLMPNYYKCHFKIVVNNSRCNELRLPAPYFVFHKRTKIEATNERDIATVVALLYYFRDNSLGFGNLFEYC